MNVDFVYSCLIDSAWFFLGICVILLVTAGVAAFAQPRAARLVTHRK